MASGVAIEDARSPAEREDMPLPHDPRTIFLGGLFFLACLAVLFVARDVVLPIVLALVLKLLLQPLVRALERLRLPKAAGALLALLLVLVVLGLIAALLTGPAAKWLGDLPTAWPKLQERFSFVHEPFAAMQRILRELGIDMGKEDSLLQVNPGALLGTVFSGTGEVASRLVETLLILFYLLVFGETFLRRMVEILPRFDDKRQAVEISLHIERDLSAYLLAITAINAVVGAATASVMWGCRIPDPVLWGVTAFCLNFVPILGPVCAVLVFALVGLMSKGGVWTALLPPALYLCIHLLEGEIITPMILARRFTINPVAVMLALIFWYWMWGVVGAILAVPIMAIVKIVCDRLRPLRAIGHFLEG